MLKINKFARRGGLLQPMLSNGKFVNNLVSIFLVQIEFNDDFFSFKRMVEVFFNFLLQCQAGEPFLDNGIKATMKSNHFFILIITGAIFIGDILFGDN